jgi:hypothetical protein
MAGRFRATASHDVTQTPVRIEGVPFDSKTNQGIGYQVKTNDSLTVYLDEATVAAVPNPDGEHPVAQVGLFNAFGGFTGDMLVTQPPQGKPTGE